MRLPVVCGALGAALAGVLWWTAEARTSSRELFERRILPIVNSPNASSCAECHLGGVDLKDYIAGTEAETFASLRDQGLVDLENPDNSKILRFIRMSAPQSGLVTQKVRGQEYEAFRDWIRACAADPKLARTPRVPAAQVKRPAAPDAVIRHGRLDRVQERFEATVWAQQQRCAACHMPGGILNAKHAAQYGDRMNWIVKDDPRATITRLIERKLIDAADPARSLLLTKPSLQVPHGGGKKMVAGDQGYRAFRAFIEDYAAIVRDRYRTEQQLPPAPRERYISTEYWLKLSDTPPEWADRLLGVDLYAFDPAAGTWSRTRAAASDRQVFGQGSLWQHNLDLVVPAGSPAPPARLAEGRYLARIYVDRTGAVEKDWTRDLRAPRNLAGEIELPPGWRPGYGAMKTVSMRALRKSGGG